jgi:hypothetical protein
MKETTTTTKQKSKGMNEAGREGKPISLAPLTFEEALEGLLRVKPETKVKATAAKKRVSKKR